MHDAYSLCFQASDGDEFDNDDKTFPSCRYPPRMLWSRPRLGKINDGQINHCFVTALENMTEKLSDDGVVLCASDFSLTSLLAAKIICKLEVLVLEQSKLAQRGLHNLALSNDLSTEVICGDVSEVQSKLNGRKVSLLCGEPHFTSSLLPWHDLYFWYLRSELQSCLHEKAKVLPCRGQLWAAAVWFKDLWKIRAPAGVVEGFDVSPMDEMIDNALNKREYHEPEPHALWEYPNRLLTQPFKVMTFEFTDLVPESDINSKGSSEVEISESEHSTCHGVVLWMQYDLDDSHTVSTGLTSSNSELDLNSPQWSMHHKQAVFLFKRPVELISNCKLFYNITFVPSTGDVKMFFEIE